MDKQEGPPFGRYLDRLTMGKQEVSGFFEVNIRLGKSLRIQKSTICMASMG